MPLDLMAQERNFTHAMHEGEAIEEKNLKLP